MSDNPQHRTEMMRRELMFIINRWTNESDLTYAELFGTLELIKLTYWRDWTKEREEKGFE